MAEMRVGPLVRGLLTSVPAINGLLRSKDAGHAASARHCYGTWTRHLTLLHAHGFKGIPRVAAELGPGESPGVGLCALLCGSDRYLGLDVIPHSHAERNRRILEELIPLFRNKAPARIKGWPDFSAYLDERGFPGKILTPELLRNSLWPERIDAIRRAVSFPSSSNPIRADHKAPWFDAHVIEQASIDLVVSSSVLEHIVDLRGAYRALYRWLKPGGWMSHQIDLKSHGLTRRWNGFRTCSEGIWKLAVGKRPYMINRAPASAHLRMMQEAGFRLISQKKHFREDGIRRAELAPQWADISDDDLNCSGLFVIARKLT